MKIMKRNHVKHAVVLFAVVLFAVVLLAAIFSFTAFADYSDGQNCGSCGHYHWLYGGLQKRLF